MNRKFKKKNKPNKSKPLSKLRLGLSLLTIFRNLKTGLKGEKMKENILRIIRHGLTVGAGYILSKDLAWLDGIGFENIEPIISGLMAWIALKMSSKSDKQIVAKDEVK